MNIEERKLEVCDSLVTAIGLSTKINNLAKSLLDELVRVQTPFQVEMFDNKADELSSLISKLYHETL